MTIIKHRDICGLVGTLCGACIVTLVALCFGVAPARAQKNFNMLPPQVAFISDGKFTALDQGNGPLLLTGTLAYLVQNALQTNYLHISVDTEGQITSNSWVAQTSQSISEWETVSTFPKTCRKEVLSGASYPQCTAWARTPRGLYVQKCTVTAQGNKTTLENVFLLTQDYKLSQMTEYATIEDENGNSQGNLIEIKDDPLTGGVIFVTEYLTITVTSQGTTPPSPFNLPSICNAPTANNQNDNSQSTELGCTGTIPNICF